MVADQKVGLLGRGGDEALGSERRVDRLAHAPRHRRVIDARITAPLLWTWAYSPH